MPIYNKGSSGDDVFTLESRLPARPFIKLNGYFINVDHLIYVEEQDNEFVVCFGGVGNENSKRIFVKKGTEQARTLTGVLTSNSASSCLSPA